MTEWHRRTSTDDYPTESGWYRVMVRGDSESIDGHTIYEYGDYETWACYTKATPEEVEEWVGGWRGSFNGIHDEDDYSIFAFYGPIEIPPFNIGD